MTMMLESPTRVHWVSDAQATHCAHEGCGRAFGHACWRHHCRFCGLIFCDRHSSKRLPLDRDAALSSAGSLVKVCDKCHDYGRDYLSDCSSPRRSSPFNSGSSGGRNSRASDEVKVQPSPPLQHRLERRQSRHLERQQSEDEYILSVPAAPQGITCRNLTADFVRLRKEAVAGRRDEFDSIQRILQAKVASQDANGSWFPSLSSWWSPTSCEVCWQQPSETHEASADGNPSKPETSTPQPLRLVRDVPADNGQFVSLHACESCHRRLQKWRLALEVTRVRRQSIRSESSQMGVQLCVAMETVRILVASFEGAVAKLAQSEAGSFVAQEQAARQAQCELQTALVTLHTSTLKLGGPSKARYSPTDEANRRADGSGTSGEARLSSQMAAASTKLVMAATIRYRALSARMTSQRQRFDAEGERRQQAVEEVVRTLDEAEEAIEAIEAMAREVAERKAAEAQSEPSEEARAEDRTRLAAQAALVAQRPSMFELPITDGLIGINPDEKAALDAFKSLALHEDFLEAAKRLDYHAMRELVVANPGIIHAQSTTKRRTALHIAAAAGEKSLVQWLLEQGAHARARDHLGRTPLDVAGSSECAKLLSKVVRRHNFVDVEDWLE